MASTDPGTRLTRIGNGLHLHGPLRRDVLHLLWPQALQALDGAETLDISAVDAVDSAGLALLAELAARLHGPNARIFGDPPGLAGLCAAYRMQLNQHIETSLSGSCTDAIA